jgi:hypothetical protein
MKHIVLDVKDCIWHSLSTILAADDLPEALRSLSMRRAKIVIGLAILFLAVGAVVAVRDDIPADPPTKAEKSCSTVSALGRRTSRLSGDCAQAIEALRTQTRAKLDDFDALTDPDSEDFHAALRLCGVLMAANPDKEDEARCDGLLDAYESFIQSLDGEAAPALKPGKPDLRET